MKAIGKPVFSLLLCLVLLVGLFPAAAFAEEPVGADVPGGLSQPQANPAGLPIDAAHFPDDAFRAYVAENLDPDKDGTLTDEEIAGVTQIWIVGRGISSLEGIEYFTALTRLDCYNNQLTSLDLSANTALTGLDCGSNQLTSLNVSGCAALTTLNCWGNQLTSLDLSANTALTGLYCHYNQLTSLDLSANTALNELRCDGNQLTSLDLSANTALTFLDCSDNQLTSLDLSANPALTGLDCGNNQLTSLDLSANTALTDLQCYGNRIESLDLRPCPVLAEAARGEGIPMEGYPETARFYGAYHPYEWNPDYTWYHLVVDASTELITGDEPAPEGLPIDEAHFPDEHFRAYVAENLDPDENGYLTDEEIASVTEIDCSEKEISSLQGIEYFTALNVLWCSNNKLTSLDVSANPALTCLDCRWNQLTSLNLSHNPDLTRLYCNDNQLTSLDLSANPALVELLCYSNQLTSLDLSANTALGNLYCQRNQLTSLDLSANTALILLYCNGNQLTSLDLSANPALRLLLCNDNQLTSLDLSANTALTELLCYNNQLTSLDLSANTALTELLCYNNQLTELDVSANTALTELYCHNNPLTSLELSANPALTYLSCHGNQLTSLDLSANTALTDLHCYDNQLTRLDLRPCPVLAEAARGEGIPMEGYPETALFYGPYQPYPEWNPDYTWYHLGVDASTELITDDTPETVKEDLKEIPEDATPEEIRETAKNLDDDALGEALLDDSVAETVKALEEQTGTGVGIEVTPELEGKIDEGQVAIVGAALNSPEDESKDIVLKIGPASSESLTIPTDYVSEKAMLFSMTLENVENTKALDVPVRIDLPVPEGMNPNTVVLLHYTGEGEPEVIKPQAVTENGVTLLRFVLTGFSDFALAQPKVSPADVNADGTVNGKDLIILRRYVAGVEGTEIDQANADMNGDGTVNGKDLILLRRLLAG